jgi:hypothetical protein
MSQHTPPEAWQVLVQFQVNLVVSVRIDTIDTIQNASSIATLLVRRQLVPLSERHRNRTR